MRSVFSHPIYMRPSQHGCLHAKEERCFVHSYFAVRIESSKPLNARARPLCCATCVRPTRGLTLSGFAHPISCSVLLLNIGDDEKGHKNGYGDGMVVEPLLILTMVLLHVSIPTGKYLSFRSLLAAQFGCSLACSALPYGAYDLLVEGTKGPCCIRATRCSLSSDWFASICFDK